MQMSAGLAFLRLRGAVLLRHALGVPPLLAGEGDEADGGPRLANQALEEGTHELENDGEESEGEVEGVAGDTDEGGEVRTNGGSRARRGIIGRAPTPDVARAARFALRSLCEGERAVMTSLTAVLFARAMECEHAAAVRARMPV